MLCVVKAKNKIIRTRQKPIYIKIYYKHHTVYHLSQVLILLYYMDLWVMEILLLPEVTHGQVKHGFHLSR
jgi:hypothetical protein